MRAHWKPTQRILAAAAAITLAAAASPLHADLSADQTPFHSFRGLWMDRFDYSTSAQITTAMQRAQALGITDMVFQVRGEANAFYNSAYEHRELASFDPLQVAITEAHNRGIRLHAWINSMPLWRGTTLPSGSDYLINQHPEYWIRDANGDPQALNSSYVTVNPTMPEVRTHLANVAADIAKKYAIDGLHLDYIRLTTNSSGTNMVYPMDPATVTRFQQAFPGQTPAANQANYKAWVAGQITLTVSGIRDALKANRPSAQLTAAVWRDADIGLSDYQQDWATWIDQGLLDAAMPMIYRKGFGLTPTANQDTDPPVLPSSTADLYRLNVAEALERRGNAGIIIGVGEYMQDNAATAYNNMMAQLNYAKVQGSNGIQLFDYGTLYNGSAAQNEVLRALTDFFNANKTAPPQTAISNFDSDEGYFATSITTSSSNQNVAASSSADRITTEAHSGAGSQRLIINKTSGATSFLARHLSGIGTAGDFNSNLQLASIGSVGFWLKTSTPDLQVSFGADDAASGSTERGFFKNVIADGQWHKYEWFLDDVGQWDSFSGGNGRLNNIFATDSIQFIGTAASNTIYFDDVFYNAAAVAPNQWTLDANSNWSNAGNWTGGIPNGLGAVANLMRRTTAARTLTLSVPTTLGTLNIDNSASYTIAGTASLNMDVASGTTAVNVINRGSHTIAAPFVLADPTNVFVDTGSTLTFSGGFATQGKALTKTGSGEMVISGAQVHSSGSTLNVNEGKATLNSNAGVTSQQRLVVNVNNAAALTMNSTQNLIALNLSSTAKATLTAGANKVVKTNGLSIAGASTLDLNDNDAIVQATAINREAVLADVSSWIASARNSISGRWQGSGITSATAAADSRGITTIAAILNDNGQGAPLYSTFDGQNVDINSILLKFTYTGDSDLDGDVDADDYAHIDAGFSGGLSGYGNGDYDFSGSINSDDFFLIDRAYSSQGTPLAGAVSAVPEPGILSLIPLGLLVLRRRRCR